MSPKVHKDGRHPQKYVFYYSFCYYKKTVYRQVWFKTYFCAAVFGFKHKCGPQHSLKDILRQALIRIAVQCARTHWPERSSGAPPVKLQSRQRAIFPAHFNGLSPTPIIPGLKGKKRLSQDWSRALTREILSSLIAGGIESWKKCRLRLWSWNREAEREARHSACGKP